MAAWFRVEFDYGLSLALTTSQDGHDPMGGSIRLGKIAGIPISIHLSWFVILVLSVVFFERYYSNSGFRWTGTERWGVSLAMSLTLFASVLAHELTHSIVAQRYGMPVRGITLFLLGGVSQIGKEATRPSSEFVIAFVGPLCSIVLGLMFLGLSEGLHGVNSHAYALTAMAAYVNFMLGVFNMLPAYPMDGGRVFRAALWKITGNQFLATRMAARVGQGMALLFIIGGGTLFVLQFVSDRGGSWNQGIWLTILGFFLLATASATHRHSGIRRGLDRFTVRDLMHRDFPVAPGEATVGRVVRENLALSTWGFTLVAIEGRISGVVTLESIRDASAGPETPCQSAMTPVEDVPTVLAQSSAYEALEAMEESNTSYALVVEDGALLGFISRREMLRLSSQSRDWSRGE